MTRNFTHLREGWLLNDLKKIAYFETLILQYFTIIASYNELMLHTEKTGISSELTQLQFDATILGLIFPWKWKQNSSFALV